MSKLKTKLARFFLSRAKKLDKDVINEGYILPTEPVTFITYDKYNVDRIHCQHMLTVVHENYIPKDQLEEMVVRGIASSLADEISKMHRTEIKKEYSDDGERILYSLDLYVCKPKQKENF